MNGAVGESQRKHHVIGRAFGPEFTHHRVVVGAIGAAELAPQRLEPTPVVSALSAVVSAETWVTVKPRSWT